MQVNLDKVATAIRYIILIVIIAIVVGVVVVSGNWKWIVLIGGILLLLNLGFMYGFLRRNMKKINRK